MSGHTRWIRRTSRAPATLATVAHDEGACYGSRLHCHWHNTDEPDVAGQDSCWACGGLGGMADATICTDCLGSGAIPVPAFRCCLECRHVYLTMEDLVAAWDAEWPEWRAIPGGQLPPGCAFCGHSW